MLRKPASSLIKEALNEPVDPGELLRSPSLVERARAAPSEVTRQKSYTFDLGTARDYDDIDEFRECQVLVVSEITGEASIKLNSLSNPAYDLTKIRKFTESIDRIFLYNASQSGETLTLTAGGADFEVSMRDIEADIADMKIAIESVDTKTAKQYGITPSDTLIISSDSEVEYSTGGSGSWAKRKEFLILAPGKFRVKFDLRHSNGSVNAKGCVYKNGAAHGPEQSTSSTSWQTKSQDLNFEAGDLCQLYLYDPDSGSSQARNFRLYGTESLAFAVVTQES